MNFIEISDYLMKPTFEFKEISAAETSTTALFFESVIPSSLHTE